jgi:PAS domain S-box-containing protein
MIQPRNVFKLLDELHYEAARIERAIAAVEQHIKTNENRDDDDCPEAPFVEFVQTDQLAKGFMASPSMSYLSLWNSDRSMEFVVVNEAFQRATGYRSEEVIGRSAEELNLWVDHRERDAALNSFATGGRIVDLEYRFRRKDGGIRHGLMAADTVDWDGRMVMVVSAIDITDRRMRAQVALTKAIEVLASGVF